MNNLIKIDYKDLYDNAPCGYLCLSPQGEIIEANDRFLEFTGFKKEEVVSKLNFIDFLSKAQRIFFETNFQPILQTQGEIQEVNFAILRKDKTSFPALVNSIEIKNESGEHVYTQSTIFDISQRKSYELQLIGAKKRADELSADLKFVNSELTEKNKLLRGGLNYSKKIQYSILPNPDKIKESFKDFYIFFQPKDEIGGDFYWYWKNETFAYVAVIDCTGHGVPGALMSMSINSMLNEILQKREVFDTGKILGALHKKVYETLQQEKGDVYSQDGCDIGICRLELSNKALTYSGANINLYLYNDELLETISATRKSIGGLAINGDFEPSRKFETVKIPYNKSSMVIMTTDGLIDQLNETNESYGIREFEFVIKKTHQNKSEKGKGIIESSISNWMKGTEQLDDMLLFGFFTKF